MHSIDQERKRQDEKWGEQNHDDLSWLGILMEEVGEVARNIIQKKPDLTHEELVQLAAVAVAWLECVARRKTGG
jgi:NTP pyrophosphatase (non-canonical NTP hydrolase)